METEFYGDWQHNGGVGFWGNLNPYIYTYQNPIKYIDPNGEQVNVVEDGIMKILNDWNPFNRARQRMSGESERNQNRRLAESTLRNVNGIAKTLTTKQTAKDLFHIATRNPDQKLLKVAEVIQDTGYAMEITGYALTISVVGAEIGVPLASLGNAVSFTGDALEIAVELSQKDLIEAGKDTGWLVAGALIDLGICKIPGITNKQAKTVREKLSDKILKTGASIKLETIKRATEKKNSEKKVK